MEDDNLWTGPATSYLRFQMAGEKALQEKRYEPAKVAFDLALSQVSHDANATFIGILDLRVEAQLRLKDFDAAFKDARKMVRIDRADPRGYLRCGQLSRLKNEIGEAKKWYGQGLKNVPDTTEGYQKILSSMKSKTVVPPKKFRDPLKILPMDLIHMTLQYLEFWDITSSLRVSKTWRNTLLATHSVWRTLDLSGTRKDVTIGSMKACIRRLPLPPTTIHLHRLTVAAVNYLRLYLERWTAIEHFSIHQSSLWSSSNILAASRTIKSLHVGKGCHVDFNSVDDILHRCEMLQSVRFDAVLSGRSAADLDSSAEMYDSPGRTPRTTHPKATRPELNYLTLTAYLGYTGDTKDLIQPPEWFCYFPNLRELRCKGFSFSGLSSDFSTARSLRRLSLEAVEIDSIFRLPSSLEILHLVSIFWSSSYTFLQPVSGGQAEDLETLSTLKDLRLREVFDDSTRFSDMLKDSPSATLMKLDVFCTSREHEQLMTLLEFGKLSKLVYLRMSDEELTDEEMETIAAHCPMLEEVDVCRLRITGVAIKALCTLTAIKTLKLLDCPRISADAIAWARRRGVTVLQQTRRSGRRVRYG